MKKIKKSILFAAIIGTVSAATAQITVNRNNYPYTGTIVNTEIDTSGVGIPLPTGGANKTWDFTKIKGGEKHKKKFVNSDWVMGSANFPESNMAFYDEMLTDTSITFINVSNTQAKINGSYDVFGGQTLIQKFNFKQMVFPTNINTSFTDSDSFFTEGNELGLDPDGPGPLPTIDSIKIKLKLNVSNKIVGYGTVKVPMGDFAVLMQESSMITKPAAYYFANNKWRLAPAFLVQLLQFDLNPDTTIQCNFLTNDARVKYPVLTYSYSPGEDTVKEVEFVSENSVVSNTKMVKSNSIAMFPNPVNTVLNFHLLNSNVQKLVVTDINGRDLMQVNCTNKNGEINLENLAPGVYYVQAINADGTVDAAQKIMKK